MEAKTPKKPLTPFFLFREKEKDKGNSMGGKEAGEKWSQLTKEERMPYIEAFRKEREKFDAYLDEQGVPRRSSRKSSTVAQYKGVRVKSILGMNEDIKNLTMAQCKALAAVAVWCDN